MKGEETSFVMAMGVSGPVLTPKFACISKWQACGIIITSDGFSYAFCLPSPLIQLPSYHHQTEKSSNYVCILNY
jgi:hypothetical protein